MIKSNNLLTGDMQDVGNAFLFLQRWHWNLGVHKLAGLNVEQAIVADASINQLTELWLQIVSLKQVLEITMAKAGF